MRRILASCLIALLPAAVPATAGSAEKAPEVGDQAPDFELVGSDGKTYRLSDFRGKAAVVLAWFPKAFTSGCTQECKSLRENGQALRQFNVAYFTASCDTPEENEKFAKSLDLDYPILSDPDKKAARAYGVVHDGRELPERWTFYIGPEGEILHIDKKVAVAKHGQDSVAQLEKLGIAKKKS
jgi:peroxiredoxin Q/BCP